MIRGKVGGGSGGGLIEVWADDWSLSRDNTPDADVEVVVETVAEHDQFCIPPFLLDGAYRERNQVAAALLRSHDWECWRVEAPDAFGWWIVYAETPQGQVSWHVSERDIALFLDVPIVREGKGIYVWDGHTSEEKYERLARLGPDGT